MKLTRNSGRITGISLLLMILVAIFSLMNLNSKIIVEGDTAATLNNIAMFKVDFWVGIIGYLAILFLDVVVSLGLYIVFKPANRKFSLVTAILRLVYTAIALVSLIFLAFHVPNIYVNGLLVAYIFFILHLFFLGITILKADFFPKIFGILLVVSVPCYIIMTYGYLFIPLKLLSLLTSIVMVPGILAELLLGVWLIIKSKKFSELENGSGIM